MRSLASLLLATTLILMHLAFAQKESPTAPLEGQRLVLTSTAKGAQIYTCKQVDGTTQWVFTAREAAFFNEKGEKVGTHIAGPIWKYRDGSRSQAKSWQKMTRPFRIPSWLLLKAVNSQGSGLMTRVDTIHRTDTHGSIAPATGCDPQHLTRVPYAATYTFYSTQP